MDEFLKGFLKGNEFGDDPSTKWVKWKHISQGKTHCKDCLELDGCWFAKNLSPNAPLHPYCHCVKMPISYSKVVDCADAQSAYSKFDPYLFDVKHEYGHGKNKAFESWGYTVADSKWLQEEIEQQALYKYSSGNYSLGKLNENGQRINIRIELDRKSGSGTVSFVTGWMVEPNGIIRLNTPYGGK